ncbi:MAG: single-stranded DNA-binding protein [Clostridia bacterium]|nr:single-stranded DNA-binding protein [Clostridia bacterium]
MITNYSENNYLELVGKITSEKVFSHEIYGESFYIFNLEVPRLSGTADCIPITISERLIQNFDLSIGKEVEIEGQFRSYNTYENQRSRLVLTVFAKEIKEHVEPEEPERERISNEVFLVGYICKKPIYRKTPFGREISDILLAVNRAYNKSDYIPCIAWGRNARFCENMEIGTGVKVVGRVQSRIYEKKHEDGTVEQRVAYEVSVGSLELVNKNDDENHEENKEAM